MRISLYSILVHLLVVLCLCLIVFVDNAEAGRRKDKRRGRPGICKYQRKGMESACDPATDTKQITLNLKRGDPATCKPTNVVTRPCSDNSLTKKKKVKGCRYERKGAAWSACDPATGLKTKVMQLKAESPTECPPTRTKTKPCGNKKRKGRKNKKIRKGKKLTG